ncbi:39S ribosomal protein L23, mitochondrial-like [Xenia sp. Carnegie-2017]|uniref:39S ribosomal protein L23, mitochondrial-like n=1 Tax=Xenia sp. Carnegie-2017 TaxID=2897299 RepID=UPI001F03C88B|nr:39S ribosomal protein L23, mitochondrial-like [Xenia sp. Carnegie-2017]
MAYLNVVRNPRLQARIFLPEWFIKCVRPTKNIPNNSAVFHVPMEMSRLDVKNYLQSIYKVNVSKVNIRIQAGKTERVLMKDGDVKLKRYPDIKLAYVTMINTEFEFPELFVKAEKKSSIKDLPADVKPEEFRWI